MVEKLLTMEEMWASSLGQADPLEEGMAIHSNLLAGKIPWTGAWWATVRGATNSPHD